MNGTRLELRARPDTDAVLKRRDAGRLARHSPVVHFR
jgi:hypothetical protein